MRKWMIGVVSIVVVLGLAAGADASMASSRPVSAAEPAAAVAISRPPSLGIPADTNDVLDLRGQCKPGDSLTVTLYWAGLSRLAGGPLPISYAGVLKDTRNGAISSSSAKHEECDNSFGCAATVKLTPVVISDIPAPYGQILFLVAVGPQDFRGDRLINHVNWHCSNPSAN